MNYLANKKSREFFWNFLDVFYQNISLLGYFPSVYFLFGNILIFWFPKKFSKKKLSVNHS